MTSFAHCDHDDGLIRSTLLLRRTRTRKLPVPLIVTPVVTKHAVIDSKVVYSASTCRFLRFFLLQGLVREWPGRSRNSFLRWTESRF